MSLRGRRAREWAAISAGLVIVGVPLLLALAAPRDRLASSNAEIPVSASDTGIAPGERRCDAGFVVPPGRDVVRLYAARVRGGRVRVEVLGGGFPRSATTEVPVPPNGVVDAPIRLRQGADPAVVCVRNVGRSPIRLGNAAAADWTGRANFGAKPPGIRIDVSQSGTTTTLELAPQVFRRAALMKSSIVKPWLVWLLIPALICLGAAGVWLVLRQPGAV